MNKIEYDINIFGDLMIIDNQNEKVETINIPSIKRLFNEKQNLINYLEDKIKENQTLVLEHINEREICDIYLAKVESFQYVLDKIKEGNYE